MHNLICLLDEEACLTRIDPDSKYATLPTRRFLCLIRTTEGQRIVELLRNSMSFLCGLLYLGRLKKSTSAKDKFAAKINLAVNSIVYGV
jgi:hypothetical protein